MSDPEQYGYESFSRAFGSFVDKNTYDGMIGKTYRIMGEDYVLKVEDGKAVFVHK